MVIRRHGKLLLKIYVSLLVQALQEGDETKRLLDTNNVENTFFKTLKTPKRSQICKNYYHGQSSFFMPDWQKFEKKVFFGLEKLLWRNKACFFQPHVVTFLKKFEGPKTVVNWLIGKHSQCGDMMFYFTKWLF